MGINFMLFASPMFLILITLEYFFSLYKNRPLYQFNDAINNFCSGILEEIGILPVKGFIIFGYYYLFEHYAFFHISSDSIISWLTLWVCVDFCYYWFHRISHRNSFFWIGHSVHHQSEQFNLSVALRQGYFQTLTSWIFYLPLALIGFPTIMFVTISSINTIYQFWIHTKTINKMGWFEKIFNTPSHHRVHHGINPEYIDKNYAGSLIIWDKLFGTFEKEGTAVDYGVTEPLDSWNPFYANIKVIKDIFYYGKQLKNKLTIIHAFFMPPEWLIKRLGKENRVISKRTAKIKNTNSPKLYMLFNLIMLLAMYAYLSFTFNKLSPISWSIALLILLSLYLLGRVANGNPHIRIIELLRTFLLITSLFLLIDNLLLTLSMGMLFLVLNYIFFKISSSKIFTALKQQITTN